MAKATKYYSREMDENGLVDWSETENSIWEDLYQRQIDIIQNRACDEFMEGLNLLNLPAARVPQLGEVNQVLASTTGWQVEQVPSLINFDAFFTLLANKKFPVATFIRNREDFDYLQEPDIFHEIFGHCPLLTNPSFAHFTHTYGKLGLAASKQDRAYLARLYWFTVEFGLLHTSAGMRIYGGGILSSPSETIYALESDKPIRQKMSPLEALRTPYRIDIMQPIYFTLNHFEQLFELTQLDIMALVNTAKKLGLKAPLFEAKDKLVS
ncbi:phenylalanine 4-monooxygenase [Aliiglaciecola sp. 3_MG-2023]|uniref:phenylalanine 4-monooxygenase n=1 Tax=Aliiglaciecola sp. 3_MG-2023 TaxID=3062644 RepID=UPI0026E3A626|nr:phenylalanine 4-monooxygenase [Aliiglaciecola sp. 3_MG-2023]MDO6695754.1 phenylalanine 4-monooxygenase [Aliiglaciecola sp. 3_MG-2023]